MKTKAILAVLVLITGATLAQAQRNDRRVSFTINLQPHVNWIHADESFLSEGPTRMGMEGGLRLDYKFERFYAVSFGVNLNQTGGNIIYKESFILDRNGGRETLQPGTKVTYRLQYIETPVAMKLMLPEIGYSTWFAEVGLDPMFNSHAFINATDNNIEKEPFENGISKFNLAWHTGIGLRYSLGGRISLQFGIVYKNTFLDVTRENDIRPADNARMNQVGLSFGVGF